MKFEIDTSWKSVLQEEFNKAYFIELSEFVDSAYASQTCYPKQSEIFNAFTTCTFNDVKVVIIGQDPYHDVNQANGLCFSVNDGIKQPPSLTNIFKELLDDINKPIPKSGNLITWAKQGVLLLNATLTVQAHNAGSHQKHGWEQFTDAIIRQISDKKENVVFLLWGGYAKKKGAKIDKAKHHVLTSGHPSPLSANRGYWFGNKHFSKTNQYLNSINKKEIQW